jgi:hypothetical protein
MDLFVVPTISFRLLYGFLILQHSRRELLCLGVTARPSAHWIARQLTEAYGWQQTPRYIVRDRDCVYGDIVIQRLRTMGIRDRPISPRSPWQNGYSERLIGSIRRDCLDHVVVFGERHLRHLLNSYQKYYNEARTHLSLHKDAPIPRTIQTVGRTLAMPVLGGLHHQYFSERKFPTGTGAGMALRAYDRWLWARRVFLGCRPPIAERRALDSGFSKVADL